MLGSNGAKGARSLRPLAIDVQSTASKELKNLAQRNIFRKAGEGKYLNYELTQDNYSDEKLPRWKWPGDIGSIRANGWYDQACWEKILLPLDIQ